MLRNDRVGAAETRNKNKRLRKNGLRYAKSDKGINQMIDPYMFTVHG